MATKKGYVSAIKCRMCGQSTGPFVVRAVNDVVCPDCEVARVELSGAQADEKTVGDIG
jgi:hypothetical protein